MYLTTILYIVGFARTLLIIAIIYFGIRLFSRYILPLLVQKGMKNMQQKMQDQQRKQQRSGKTEGEVTIEEKGNFNKKDKSTDGEYVDFEEVE